jgi:hypothetical protein
LFALQVLDGNGLGGLLVVLGGSIGLIVVLTKKVQAIDHKAKPNFFNNKKE